MNLENFKTNMEKLYATYCENLYFYKNENHSKLEEMNIKSLNTPTDKKKFFVVRNSEGIVIVTTSLSSAISLSFKEYKEYLQGNELQHKSYAIPVFDEILRANGFECETGKFWHTSGYDLHIKSVKDWGEKRKKMDTGHSCLLYHNAPYKNIYAVGTIAINGNNFSVLDIKPLENKITDNEIRFFWSDFNPQPTQQFKNRMLLNYIIKQNSDIFYINHIDSQHASEKTVETNKSHPLNQILYGSPGTGKTYSTIDKALSILGFNNLQEDSQLDYEKIRNELEKLKSEKNLDINMDKSNDRICAKALFDHYHKKGQIGFVTFHQNYGYEEFVEGIKPKLDNNKEIEYEVKDGVFKSLCTDADNFNYIDLNTNLWRLYTFPNGDQGEDYFDECVKENFVYAYSGFGMEELQFKVKKGDYIIIPSVVPGKRSKSIRAFGVLGNVITNTSDANRSIRAVEWKWIATNEEQELSFKQADFGIPAFRAVEKEKETILKTLQKYIRDTPHILIIDEINRGNVSKIFGELITLIEPSKRIGESEELQVVLPYSQKPFGVPSNLYIIGTMNTADRSITSLDTALRRRFEFVEMMPDATKLKSIEVMHDGEKKTINLKDMLQAINERIEFLYDREKTIGHAYLMDIDSLSGLKDIFQNKIIPLLQEYFYNDYEAIQAVLNDNGMIRPKDSKGRNNKDFLTMGKFKDFLNDRGLDEKKVFEITPKDEEKVWNNPSTYTKIYGVDENKKTQPNNDKTDTPSEPSDNQ